MTSKNIPRLSISVSRSAACFFQSGRLANAESGFQILSLEQIVGRQRAANALVHHGEAVVRRATSIEVAERSLPGVGEEAAPGYSARVAFRARSRNHLQLNRPLRDRLRAVFLFAGSGINPRRRHSA
jgi:hypothetical protein